MDYCAPRGLPLSQFLSWPQIDQDAALAWQQRQAEVCGGCGIHPDVTDPELGGDPSALKLGTRLCVTCEIKESESERFQKARFPGQHQVWERTDG
jgi:hypothetical protein